MKYLSDIPNTPKPVGAYTPAVVAGNLLFCSGQIALDPESGALVEGGIEAQTKQVLANLKALLEGCGSSIDKIAMTTIFLADMSDVSVVNELYGSFVVEGAYPARQTVAVKQLPLGALVEISVIATV